MNPPAKTKTVSEEVLARASRLHDRAYADATCEQKPSWADSVAEAETQLAAEKAAAQKRAEDAAALAQHADAVKADADQAAAEADVAAHQAHVAETTAE